MSITPQYIAGDTVGVQDTVDGAPLPCTSSMMITFKLHDGQELPARKKKEFPVLCQKLEDWVPRASTTTQKSLKLKARYRKQRTVNARRATQPVENSPLTASPEEPLWQATADVPARTHGRVIYSAAQASEPGGYVGEQSTPTWSNLANPSLPFSAAWSSIAMSGSLGEAETTTQSKEYSHQHLSPFSPDSDFLTGEAPQHLEGYTSQSIGHFHRDVQYLPTPSPETPLTGLPAATSPTFYSQNPCTMHLPTFKLEVKRCQYCNCFVVYADGVPLGSLTEELLNASLSEGRQQSWSSYNAGPSNELSALNNH